MQRCSRGWCNRRQVQRYILHKEDIMKAEEFLAMYDAGKKFSECQIADMAFDFQVEHEEYGDRHRWQLDVTTYINVEGRVFRVDWLRGLTENQENEYPNQPVEVRKKTYQKTITVTEYEPVK